MQEKLKDLTVKELKEICKDTDDCIICPIKYLCERDPCNWDGRILNSKNWDSNAYRKVNQELKKILDIFEEHKN